MLSSLYSVALSEKGEKSGLISKKKMAITFKILNNRTVISSVVEVKVIKHYNPCFSSWSIENWLQMQILKSLMLTVVIF